MKRIALALLLLSSAAYAADKPTPPAQPPTVTAADARDLLALISRADVKGSEAMRTAQLEILLTNIARTEPATK